MKITHVLFTFLILALFSEISAAVELPQQIPQAVDISINGIYINNPQISKIIPEYATRLIKSKVDLPHANLSNKNKNQILILIFHPGDIKNSFSEFRVEPLNSDFTEEFFVMKNINSFCTGKKISLGMDKHKVISILGKKFEEEIKGDIEIIKYLINDFNNSSFLKHYNMPIYKGIYEFKNKKLLRFSFGFEYP